MVLKKKPETVISAYDKRKRKHKLSKKAKSIMYSIATIVLVIAVIFALIFILDRLNIIDILPEEHTFEAIDDGWQASDHDEMTRVLLDN